MTVHLYGHLTVSDWYSGLTVTALGYMTCSKSLRAAPVMRDRYWSPPKEKPPTTGLETVALSYLGLLTRKPGRTSGRCPSEAASRSPSCRPTSPKMPRNFLPTSNG